MSASSLSTLSTEELIQKCLEAGIKISEDESTQFRGKYIGLTFLSIVSELTLAANERRSVLAH